MTTTLTMLATLILFSVAARSAPDQGDVRESEDGIEVWHTTIADWISPDEYFDIEIKRLGGLTYGTVEDYPPHRSVQEWDTLIDRLPDGRVCPMVFFHQRWRRLPDVLALDSRFL